MAALNIMGALPERCPDALIRALLVVLVTMGNVYCGSAHAQALSSVSQTRSQDGTGRHEFEFARLVYRGTGEGGWPRWQADWPEAETHFSAGLKRLTRIDVSPEGQLIDFSEGIFDYPWLYAVEVGALTLDSREAAVLREYLLRGGFLVVDDFHGNRQWRRFSAAMTQLFPDREIIDLQSGNELFHTLYDLTEREQIPGIRSIMRSRTWEHGGYQPHWRGIVDDHGRIMVAINFNMDLGDAWEHADDRLYPQRYTALAYRLGINTVVYAMTH